MPEAFIWAARRATAMVALAPMAEILLESFIKDSWFDLGASGCPGWLVRQMRPHYTDLFGQIEVSVPVLRQNLIALTLSGKGT
jgi:hypothetical protein